jgi:hypothetical protein
MFGKPLSALNAADILQLCRDQVRESDVVEFKRALSGKSGPDGWHTGAPDIAPAARDKIVNEVIAFANAHGGTLVLGIAETDDKPPRADKVALVQRCADLAERLSRALADTVEPPLAPFPAIVPVAIEGDAGVVIFEVAASRNAPHRHRGTLQSHVRRGEQVVPMTMREIQDLTLQVERGLALLDRQFSDSAERFATICRPSTGLGLRATVVPLSPLSLPIPNDTAIAPNFKQFKGTFGKRDVQLQVPATPNTFRPMLRGIRAGGRDIGGNGTVSLDITATGFLEIFFIRPVDDRLALYATWFAGLACNAISMADFLRQAAGAPGTEYGLELAVFAPGRVPVGAYGGREYGFDEFWTAGAVTFPKYSVGERAHFGDVIELLDRDFWNAVGARSHDPLRVEF